MEILSLLPMKTLLSCWCVCKFWQTLLADPHFTHLYLSRAPISLLLRTLHKRRKRTLLHWFDVRDADTDGSESRLKLRYNTRLPNIDFDLVNSSNGLLCLCKRHDIVRKDPIYVCKAILAEFVTLPQVSAGLKVDSVAFGFSSRTNEYKVLRIVRTIHLDAITWMYNGNDDYEAEIYDLGSGSRRSIGKPRFRMKLYPHFLTYVNGAIHWSASVINVNHFICAFDFETEEFRVVPDSPIFGMLHKQYSYLMRIGVLKGCLSICNFSYTGEDYAECIHLLWMMKEYGVKESWTKLYSIDNLIFRNSYSIDMYCYDPIMILDNGKILMLFNENSLVNYDPNEEIFNFLSIIGVASKFEAIGFIPSFVSPWLLANM